MKKKVSKEATRGEWLQRKLKPPRTVRFSVLSKRIQSSQLQSRRKWLRTSGLIIPKNFLKEKNVTDKILQNFFFLNFLVRKKITTSFAFSSSSLHFSSLLFLTLSLSIPHQVHRRVIRHMPEEEKQHQSRSEKNFSTLHCARTRSRIPQRPLGRSSLPLSTEAVPARADSRQPSRLFPQRFHFPLATSFIHSIDSSAAWRTKSASCSHLRQRLFPQRLQRHLLTGVWPVRVEQKIPCYRSRNRFPQRVGARPVHPHWLHGRPRSSRPSTRSRCPTDSRSS